LAKVWVEFHLVYIVVVEEKVNTIHFLPHCWLLRPECLRSHSVLCFDNLEMKFVRVVNHCVLFSKSSHLIDLKLSFKSCTSLSGEKVCCLLSKRTETSTAIEDRQVFFLIESLISVVNCLSFRWSYHSLFLEFIWASCECWNEGGYTTLNFRV